MTDKTLGFNEDDWKNDPINWPLTTESVIEFHQTFGDLRMNGYEIANEHYILKLNEILGKVSSFEELKQELTIFLKGRQEFGDFLEKRFDNGEYHI